MVFRCFPTYLTNTLFGVCWHLWPECPLYLFYLFFLVLFLLTVTSLFSIIQIVIRRSLNLIVNSNCQRTVDKHLKSFLSPGHSFFLPTQYCTSFFIVMHIFFLQLIYSVIFSLFFLYWICCGCLWLYRHSFFCVWTFCVTCALCKRLCDSQGEVAPYL